MKHIPDTVGLKIINTHARNHFELPIQLTSGNFTTVQVQAHTQAEAERMAKQHGYHVLKHGHVDMPAPRGIVSGWAALAWGTVALVASTAPAWWPKVAALLGVAG